MAAAAAPVKSYSLWVMPKGPVAEKLHTEIRQLAARTPGAPPFQPHVTLLGGVHTTECDMLTRAQHLAGRLKELLPLIPLQPYRIEFDRVAYGAIFHQCVYILCRTQPDTMQAGAAAREAYGQDSASKYIPHLSLLYSDISEDDRIAVAEEAQCRLFGREEEQAPVAHKQAPLLQEEELGFDVSSLTVWETEESDKTLLSWRQLAEFPLQG